MYALRKRDGTLVLSTRTGLPLTYSERKYADYAVKHLRKECGRLEVVKA